MKRIEYVPRPKRTREEHLDRMRKYQLNRKNAAKKSEIAIKALEDALTLKDEGELRFLLGKALKLIRGIDSNLNKENLENLKSLSKDWQGGEISEFMKEIR